MKYETPYQHNDGIRRNIYFEYIINTGKKMKIIPVIIVINN